MWTVNYDLKVYSRGPLPDSFGCIQISYSNTASTCIIYCGFSCCLNVIHQHLFVFPVNLHRTDIRTSLLFQVVFLFILSICCDDKRPMRQLLPFFSPSIYYFFNCASSTILISCKMNFGVFYVTSIFKNQSLRAGAETRVYVTGIQHYKHKHASHK